ncbi:MAG: response regulator [Anaerolineaceae bacterium]|nr:response regulator [Anaerolineaceae bacterium]
MAKILIVEDEKDIRQLITFTLQYAGHVVVAGKDGNEAVSLAKQELPDLILMDVRMPRLDGYEACELIKADDATKEIPIIFLSAKGQDTEIERGFAVGASDYLLKPFTPTELISRVASILS